MVEWSETLAVREVWVRMEDSASHTHTSLATCRAAIYISHTLTLRHQHNSRGSPSAGAHGRATDFKFFQYFESSAIFLELLCLQFHIWNKNCWRKQTHSKQRLRWISRGERRDNTEHSCQVSLCIIICTALSPHAEAIAGFARPWCLNLSYSTHCCGLDIFYLY